MVKTFKYYGLIKSKNNTYSMTGLRGTFCSGLLTMWMVRLVMSTPSSLSSAGEAIVVSGDELRDMTSDWEELANS